MSSNLFTTPGKDAEMEQAAQKARKSFRYFWREMSWERRRIIPGTEIAIVKAAFSDPPELKKRNPGGLDVEYMWLVDIDFDGKQLSGTLNNEPHSLKSISEGERVSFSGKQLYDWMYVIDGQVMGGFTVDVMRSRMGRAERKSHDNAWGLDFGETGQIYLVPPDWVEGKQAKKKGLFGFGKSKSVPQDYAKISAMEHPMSVNMRQSLDDALKENPGMLDESDDANGFTFLHQLALAGSLDGVDICLKHGADVNQKARNGLNAIQLAKSLGWNRVVKRLEEAMP